MKRQFGSNMNWSNGFSFMGSNRGDLAVIDPPTLPAVTVAANHAAIQEAFDNLDTSVGGYIFVNNGGTHSGQRFSLIGRDFEDGAKAHIIAVNQGQAHFAGIEIFTGSNILVRGLNAKLIRLADGPDVVTDGRGVVHLVRPCRNITIEECEVSSRSLEEMLTSGDLFQARGTVDRAAFGVTMSTGTGYAQGIVIRDNHIHDVQRAVQFNSVTGGDIGIFSYLIGNRINNAYQNYWVAGSSNGIRVYDNECIDVWGGENDLAFGAGVHASTGFSGDNGLKNIFILGNRVFVGTRRAVVEAANYNGPPGEFVPTKLLLTGMKFNDPRNLGAYTNIYIAYNLFQGPGQSPEVSAGLNIYIWNNTFIEDLSGNSGSLPVTYFQGCQGVRFWNNIHYTSLIGPEDDSGPIFPRTRDTLQGYGNLDLVGGLEEAERFFNGHPEKGFANLTPAEAVIAYTPKVNTGVGAIGTGKYTVGGIHNDVFDQPHSDTGVTGNYPLTLWDENHAEVGSLKADGGSQFSVKFQGMVSNDGTTRRLFITAGENIAVTITSGGGVNVRIKGLDGQVVVDASSSFSLQSGEGLVTFEIILDLVKHRVQFFKNGEEDSLSGVKVMNPDGQINWSNSANRIGAHRLSQDAFDHFAGAIGLLAINDVAAFRDDHAAMREVYAADGTFIELDLSNELLAMRGAAQPTNTGSAGPLTFVSAPTDYAGERIASATSRSLYFNTIDNEIRRLSLSLIVENSAGNSGVAHVVVTPETFSNKPSQSEVVSGAGDAGAPAVASMQIPYTNDGMLAEITPELPIPTSGSVRYQAHVVLVEDGNAQMSRVRTSVAKTLSGQADNINPTIGFGSTPFSAPNHATVNGSISSSELNGGIVVLTGTLTADEPDKFQVRSGQDHEGNDALVSIAAAASNNGAGEIDISVIGFEETTTYNLWAVRVDATGNVSDVLEIGPVTTPVDTGGVYIPRRVVFEAGAFAEIINVSNAVELVVAFRAKRLSVDGTGSAYIASSSGSSNTQVFINDDTDRLFFRVEATNGLKTLNYFGTPDEIQTAETISVHFRMKSGFAELSINGIVVATGTAAYSALKNIDTLGADGTDGASLGIELIGGWFQADTVGACDALPNDQFFDPSSNPTFNSNVVNGITARFFQNGSAEDWNTDPGLSVTGTIRAA